MIALDIPRDSCHQIGHKMPGHCTCCGSLITENVFKGQNMRTLGSYRQLTFHLTDPRGNSSTTTLSFCYACACHPFTPNRLQAIKAQWNDAYYQSLQGRMYWLIDGQWGLKETTKKPIWTTDPETGQREWAWAQALRLSYPAQSVAQSYESEPIKAVLA